MRRLGAALCIAGALLIVAAVLPTSADGAVTTPSTTLSGEGESWPALAMNQLESDAISSGNISGMSATYLGVNALGEDGARQDFANGTTDFDVTEAPLSPSEISTATQTGLTPEYIPYGLGSVAIVLGLSYLDANDQPHLITGMHLTMDTLAKIFQGVITLWSNSAILAENPTLAPILENLSNSVATINVIQRTDSSATTSALLAAIRASGADGFKYYTSFTPATGIPPDQFPSIDAANVRGVSDGSQIIAEDVLNIDPHTGVPSSQLDDAISYLSPAWAAKYGIPVVAIQNIAGNFEVPTAQTVTDAVTSGSTFDTTTNLYSMSENFDYSKMAAADAYPIPLASYMVVPTQGAMPAKAAAMAGLANFALSTAGQADLTASGMVPLTAPAQTAASAEATALAASSTTTTSTSSATSTTAVTVPTTSTTALSSSTTPTAAAGPIVSAAGGAVPVGGSVTITGSGWPADTPITFTLHSTPVTVGTAATTTAGAFSFTFTIPSNTPAGSHTVEAADAAGATASTPLTVSAAPSTTPTQASTSATTAGAQLPVTGSGRWTWWLAVVGAALVVAGVAVGRRERSAAP